MNDNAIVTPDDLPPPDTIITYGPGWFGPLFLHWLPEGGDWVQAARDAGFDCLFVCMDDELGNEHEICVDHFEHGVDAAETLQKWQPRDQGDRWRLVGKYDHEDGPQAMFIRPLPK